MAQQTALTLSATPGQVQSFSAKTPADATPRVVPQLTILSLMATPGRTQTFTAKIPGDGTGRVVPQLTTLSLMATPGQVYSFTAKGEAPVIPPDVEQPPPPVPDGEQGGGDYPPRIVYTKAYKAYRDWIYQMDEVMREYDALQPPERVKAIKAIQRPPKVSRREMKAIEPVLRADYPGIGIELPKAKPWVKVQPEITFPSIKPKIIEIITTKKGRKLSDDELWFLMDEDVL